MLSENLDIDRILMAVLEAIYRVLELDQVVFATINPKSKRLQAKLMIGKRKASFIDRARNTEVLQGQMNPSLRNWFTGAEAVWMKDADLNKAANKKIDPLITELAAKEFFVSPIAVSQTSPQSTRPIGLIYADRFSLHRPLIGENLRSFEHLSNHAALAFKFLSRK